MVPHTLVFEIKRTIQFGSVAQSCPTLYDPMDCSTPGLPVRHQLPEFTQTHVLWVGDAIQPSLPSPSPTFDLSQHQGLFRWVSFSNQVAKVLEFQLQHQSFQWAIYHVPLPSHESVVALISGFFGDIMPKFLTNQSFPIYSKEQGSLVCFMIFMILLLFLHHFEVVKKFLLQSKFYFYLK